MRRHNFKNLQIWHDAIDLVKFNYEITATFPDFEKYGLKSQMNRCAVSIPSNIAEVTSKGSNKHFVNYLETTLGSAFEWETQLIICNDLQYVTHEKFSELEMAIKKLQQKISNFIDKIDSSQS